MGGQRRGYHLVPFYASDALLVNAVRGFVLPRLRQHVTAGGAVLDVGCGARPLRAPVIGRGGRYVGIDLAADSSADVRADAGALPFRSASFDVVLLTEVLEHVSDPAALLREVSRALRPGAALLMTVPFLYPEHGDVDFGRPTPRMLRALCEESQLDVVEVVPLGGGLAPAVTILDHALADSALPRSARLAVRVLTQGGATALRRLHIRPGRRSAPLGHGVVARRRHLG